MVLEMEKSLIFPLPLLTAAHQQLLAGITCISYIRLLHGDFRFILSTSKETFTLSLTGFSHSKKFGEDSTLLEVSIELKLAYII